MKDLKNLTKEEFTVLKNGGILKSLYPDAPDNYQDLFEDAPVLRDIDEYDILRIKNFAKEIVDSKLDGRYFEDNDDKTWAYEMVMEIAYGKDIWKFMND